MWKTMYLTQQKLLLEVSAEAINKPHINSIITKNKVCLYQKSNTTGAKTENLAGCGIKYLQDKDN